MKKIFSLFLALMLVATAAVAFSARKLSGKPAPNFSLEQKQERKSNAWLSAQTKRPKSRAFLSAPTSSTLSAKDARRAAVSRAEGLPNFYGVNTGSDEVDPGLYRIPTSDEEEFEEVFSSPIFYSSFAGVEVDGIWYQSYYDEEEEVFYLFQVDLSTKSIIAQDEVDAAHAMTAVTKDPNNGDVYALTWDESEEYMQLCKVTFEDGEMIARVLLELDDLYTCIAADSEGLLYGIQMNGKLYQFDLEEEEINYRGDTGILPNGFSGAVIDPETDTMYWSVYTTTDFEGYLTQVSLVNASTEVIYKFPYYDQVTSLYIAGSMYADGAPVEVQDLTAEFPKGSTDGTVAFTAPTLLTNGSAATGSLSYTVRVEYDEETYDVAEGTCAPGEAVSIPVSVDDGGTYVFSVFCSTAEGAGPTAKVSVYVGYGTPAKPVVKAELTDAGIVISWEPVTKCAGQGYIDPEAVTYTVTRVNDNKVIASEISETSVTDPIEVTDALKLYSYKVVAHNDEKNSAAVTTDPIKVGKYVTLPFNETFESQAAFDLFTVIDVQGDEKTWEYYNRGHHARATYHSDNVKDDWLITPPLKMTAGNVYNLAATAAATRDRDPEIIEIKLGKEPTAEAMTTVLVKKTDIPTALEENLAAEFTIDEDGLYYIGFHAISEAGRFNLILDNIHITETSGLTPELVSDLSVVPDIHGALKTVISFTVHTKTINGSTLSSIDKVEISRDDKVITTLDAAPGQTLNYTDTDYLGGGDYSYSIVVYSGSNASKPAEQKVHVGYGRPATITDITAVETATLGTVHLAWPAITTDVDGKIYPEGSVTYAICINTPNGWVIDKKDIADTEIDYKYQEPDARQSFTQIGIMAYYENFSGRYGIAPIIPVGPAYTDYSESFTNADLDHLMVTYIASGDAEWQLFKDGEGINSQDDDNGLTVMSASQYDAAGEIISGNISLEGLTNPKLSFWTYNLEGLTGMPADENIINLQVRKKGETQWKSVLNKSVSELCTEKAAWNRIIVDLAQYAGQIIQYKIAVTVKNASVTAFDNITVGTLYACDIVPAKIVAPAKVVAGSEYDVQVTVVNDGLENAENIVVKLLANGKEVQSKSIDAIKSGERVPVDFTTVMSPLSDAAVTLTATVECAADEHADNNTSSEVIVTPRTSTLPAVADLEAHQDGKGITLQWSAPDLSKAPLEETVTESFENADDWADFVEGWQFVDMDESPIGGLEGIDIPNHPAQSYASFWVMDGTGYDEGLAAHTGNKYLMSSFLWDGDAADDWAISPRLTGEAQSISFYARSLDFEFNEVISVYYSTEDTDNPTQFNVTKVADASVPYAWTLFTVELPEGATYFAVRSHAYDAMMLMLDDFTFAQPTALANNALVGYDIYRGDTKVNDEPVTEVEYVDADGAGSDIYQVVVVYERGMSPASNRASVVTGVEDIAIDGADAPAEYFNLQGIRIAEPTEGQVVIIRKGANTAKILK